jgi:hypothetical protein
MHAINTFRKEAAQSTAFEEANLCIPLMAKS